MANDDFTQVHKDDLAALSQMLSTLCLISEMLQVKLTEMEGAIQLIKESPSQ